MAFSFCTNKTFEYKFNLNIIVFTAAKSKYKKRTSLKTLQTL